MASAEPALPPGPRGQRALSTVRWVLRPLPLLERCRERYGDVFTLRIHGEAPWVVLADPAAVKEVFTGDAEVLQAGVANVILRPVVGRRSVIVLDGPEHLAERRLLLPPFHGERMERYGRLVREIADREIACWPRNEPLRMAPRMRALTLEVILRAVFGVRETDRLDALRPALRNALELTVSPFALFFFLVAGPERTEREARLRRALDRVDRLLFEEVARRRVAGDLAERDDVLSLLLQARHDDGRPMSDPELRDELMTLLVAGHETSATALSWALERLVRHPAKLERLREEAAAGDDSAYLDATVKETLRLRPVVPMVLRRLAAPLHIAGHDLPAGVNVAPCVYLVHRREDVYPEARAFRPERFLEQPAGTYTWIPFGGGVRRCLGASFALFEMATVLRAVVSTADLRPAQPAPERMVRRAVTFVPAGGASVVVIPRRAAGPPPAAAAAAGNRGGAAPPRSAT